MRYIDEIKNFKCFNEQESKDKELMLNLYNKFGDELLNRGCNVAHFSASAIILNKKHDKVLFGYHNIYKNYGWLGGHADGMDDLLMVAKKEVNEESGLSELKLLNDKAISLEILPVGYHYKHNEFVSSHLHLNLTYIFEADENSKIRIKPDENSDLVWIPIIDIKKIVKEEIMIPIYYKILQKAGFIKEKNEI